MPSLRVHKNNNSSIYYLTFTVHNWYYLFDRYHRWEILSDSLQYCMKNKGLKLYGFVFMLNHIHFIVSSSDISGFIRNFKKYTSKQLKENLIKTEPNVLKLFIDDDGVYEFWQKTNMPLIVESKSFFLQKLSYLYQNPVKKQYVLEPQDWYWSSANMKCVLRPNAAI
jgi:putative transposase